MSKRLAGKSVLITGASSGIGRAIAVALLPKARRLLLADITMDVREGGTPTLDLLRATVMRSISSRSTSPPRATPCAPSQQTVARFGRLDVLVNDAAIGTGKRLTDDSLAEWNRTMAVNLTGVFLMSRAAVRQMLTQDIRNEARGRIVNISSQHGMIACPEDIAYGTSKAGVVYITRQIAADYAKITSSATPSRPARSSPANRAVLPSRAGWTTPPAARRCRGWDARRRRQCRAVPGLGRSNFHDR